MAVITLDFHSKALKMCTLVTLVVPDSVRIKGIPLSARRTVYLLHGLSEDATAFLRLSGAERVCACARSRAGYAYGRAQHVLRRD